MRSTASHPRPYGLVVLVATFVAALLGLVVAPAASAQTSTVNVVKLTTLDDGTVATAGAGSMFTLTPVPELDGMTPQELSDAVQRNPELLNTSGVPAFTGETLSSGIAKFEGVPYGVYRVVEVATRSGDVASTTASPFLISVPGPDGGDVTAFAKPQPITIDLELTPSPVEPGEKVCAQLKGSVPEPDSLGRLYRYGFVLEGLEHTNSPAVDRVWISGAGADVELLRDRDYSVVVVGGEVRIELTEQGLATLAELRGGRPGVRVNATVCATVDHDVRSGAVLSARARLYVDGASAGGQAAVAASASETVVVRADDDHETPSRGDQTEADEASVNPWGRLPDWWPNGGGDPPSGGGGNPQSDGGSSGADDSRRLAETGASVLGVAALGLAAIFLGLAILRRRRDGDEDQAGAEQ